MILIWGALLGFIGIGIGAFAEHGLSCVVSGEELGMVMTAIRYNQLYAIVIIAIGLALLGDGKLSTLRVLRWSGIVFIVGTVVFSFSIYLSAILCMPSILQVTPMGGSCIMVGWLLLATAGFLAKKRTKKL